MHVTAAAAAGARVLNARILASFSAEVEPSRRRRIQRCCRQHYKKDASHKQQRILSAATAVASSSSGQIARGKALSFKVKTRVKNLK